MFLLPQGRFRYLRAPMGLNASTDKWCHHSDVAVEGLDCSMKIVDDIIMWAMSADEMWTRINIVLNRCKAHNIMISCKKLEIGDEIEFVGHIVSQKWIRPDPAKFQAIRDFPAPKNIKELRSYMGLANQLSSFIPDLLQRTANMRKLLSPKNEYVWTPTQEEEFKRSKDVLLSTKIVQPFNPRWTTVVLTDASRLNGIRFTLVQFDPALDTWSSAAPVPSCQPKATTLQSSWSASPSNTPSRSPSSIFEASRPSKYGRITDRWSAFSTNNYTCRAINFRELSPISSLHG